MVQLEDLIDDLGGFGRYQFLLTICISSHLLPVGWSMLQMSFVGYVPNFYCVQSLPDNSSVLDRNDTLNECAINGSECSSYVYDIVAPNVITQWNLVCDKGWIKRIIISVQMAGVFIGAVLAGYLSDAFGRKKVLLLAQVLHVIINFVAAASSNWLMFVCCRFLIGISLGGALVVALPYPTEFYPIKWRPLTGCLPFFNIGIAMFALATYLIPSWHHLHIVCGILSIFPLLGLFFVPESIRWLTIQNKVDKTKIIIDKMAYWNGKPVPDYAHSMLQQIAIQEQVSRENKGQYTYIDIFRGWHETKISLALFFFWFSLSASYYGISFGVSSLAGNIHLNIFLMTALEAPTTMSVVIFSNTLGRRRSSVLFFGLTMLLVAGCVLLEMFGSVAVQTTWIGVLCISAKLTINCVWAIIVNWGPELYPTVTRYLGFGFSNMGGRIGGVVSPFFINFDTMKRASYGTLMVIFALCCIIPFFLPETKGRVLRDTFDLPTKSKNFDMELKVREKSTASFK